MIQLKEKKIGLLTCCGSQKFVAKSQIATSLFFEILCEIANNGDNISD